MMSPVRAARVCRACMRRATPCDLRGLYDAERGGYREKMAFCTGLEISENDGLPSYICDRCAVLLDTAHQFKTTCLKTDAALRAVTTGGFDDMGGDSFIIEFLEDMTEDEDDTTLIRVKLEPEETLELNLEAEKALELKDNLKLEPADALEPQDDLNKGSEEIKRSRTKRKMKSREDRVAEISELKPKKKYKRRRALWCEICHIKFSNKQLAKKHREDLHSVDRSLVCEFCGKLHKNRSSHYSHLLSHMPPMFPCDVCSFRSCHKSGMKKHMRTHSDLKQYQCESCPAAYYSISNLREHIKRTHEGRRDHMCHICSYKFFTKVKLLQHIDSHNGIKRYQCSECGKALSRRNLWTRHMLQMHGIHIEPPRQGRPRKNHIMEQELADALLEQQVDGRAGRHRDNIVVAKGKLRGDDKIALAKGKVTEDGEEIALTKCKTGGDDKIALTKGKMTEDGDKNALTKGKTRGGDKVALTKGKKAGGGDKVALTKGKLTENGEEIALTKGKTGGGDKVALTKGRKAGGGDKVALTKGKITEDGEDILSEFKGFW